jgi:hypothetical protein
MSNELRIQEEILGRIAGEARRKADLLLRGFQTVIEGAVTPVAARPAFADTPRDQSDKATSGNQLPIGTAESVPSWVRVIAQLIVTGVVAAFLGILGLKSTAFMFSVPPDGAQADQLAVHQQNRAFAQDTVKTLLSFSLGILTGLVAVR